MQLSRVYNYALRLNCAQPSASGVGQSDRVVGRYAILLAACGITLSSFSVKQMLKAKAVKVA